MQNAAIEALHHTPGRDLPLLSRPSSLVNSKSAPLLGHDKPRISCVLRHALAATKVIVDATILWGALANAQEPTHFSWLDRATMTRSNQPDWVTPLITASANLEEAPIYDISRRLPPSGHPIVTAGGPRGIQFVPFGKLQLTFGATPYLIHNDPKLHDGFGDTTFAFKYRLASGNEQHGNFALSAQIGASIATGSYQNGQKSDALTPNLLVEKGWGRFNVQSTFGATLPLGNTRLTGRQFDSNTAFQSRFARILWPELELNSTAFQGGPNAGKTQSFLTPGVILGRFPITRSTGLAFGVGMQIAATQYHSYGHSLLFSVRLPIQSHRRE
jgi:Putative MetA-pathway of phenol degradation